MSRYSIFAAIVTLVVATAGVSAQDGQRRGGAAPAAAEKPAAKSAAAPAEAPAMGQPLNVKLDITITDQNGPGDPTKKTVSMIVADRASGSIRSIGNNVRAMLNVDATPQILPTGVIRVQLALEYNPQKGDGPATRSGTPHQGAAINSRVGPSRVPGVPTL